MKIFYQEFKSFPQAMDIIERNNLITPQNGGYIEIETLLSNSIVRYPVIPDKLKFENFYYQMVSIITNITKKSVSKEMINKTRKFPEKIKEFYDYGSFLNDNFYIKSLFEDDMTYLQILDGYLTFFHDNYEYNYYSLAFNSFPVFFKNLEFILDKHLSERNIARYSFIILKPEVYTPNDKLMPTKGLHFKIKYEDPNGFLIEYHNPSGKYNVPKKHFICQDCGKVFYISGEQQKYFLDKKLKLPKRCKECRDFRKADKNV